MTRKTPAHGTYAGFQRHRRSKEAPCDACAQARRDYDRERKARRREEQAQAQRERDVESVLTQLDEEVEAFDRIADLRDQRRVMKAALEGLLQSDPAKLPAISKELREINREIEQLKAESQEEVDPLAEFFNAEVIDLHTASGR